jgi:hypothetical protein
MSMLRGGQFVAVSRPNSVHPVCDGSIRQGYHRPSLDSYDDQRPEGIRSFDDLYMSLDDMDVEGILKDRNDYND